MEPPEHSHHRYLLAQRLLLPLVVVAVVLSLLVTSLLYKNMHDMLDEMAVQRAVIAAQTLHDMARNTPPGQLQQSLKSFRLEGDIANIMLVQGHPPVIVISSDTELHNQPVSALNDARVEMLLHQAMATGQQQAFLDETADAHTFIMPLKGESGAVVVRSDLRMYDTKAHQQLVSIAFMMVVVVMGLAGVMYLLLHHSVLAPLTEMDEVIRARKNGKLNQRITHTGNDELGKVAQQLNHMMDVENLVQSKLAQYADEMDQQNQALTHARDEAERATRHKSEFLAMISHEIRTPMNAIIGTMGLMEKTQLDARQKRYLQTVSGSAEILLEIINSVLDFSKIEAGKLTLDARPANLGKTLESVAQIISPRVEEKGLVMRLRVARDVPPRVEVDALRLRQILVNLVSNAVKFTARGGIAVEVEKEAEKNGKAMVRFKVVDTGIGISPAKQVQIFEKFTQAEVGTTRKYGGTGLGLAISCQLVGLMGGNIGVESEEGKGSTFWFTLPLKPVNEEQVRKAEADAADNPPTPIKGGHVLLVEDNAINQMMEQEMLEQMGLKVTCANNGFQAVKKVEGGGDFNLILMDCQMPEMDGYLATQKIRMHEAGKNLPHMPIIALTANVSPEDQQKCLQAGMDDYLAKPVRLNDLEVAVSRWINEGKKA